MEWIERVEVALGGTDRAILAGVLCCLALLVFLTACKTFGWIARACYSVKMRARLRRQRKTERVRQMQYLLPERENEYLRARLQGALQKREETREGERVFRRVGLEYAQKTLRKIEGKELPPAERLEVEGIAQSIAEYSGKEEWTEKERRAVNELLARLLKLSAKYEIAV